MNKKKSDGRPADLPPTPPNAPITPTEEPSALERGARILERLRRRPPEGGAD